MGIWEGCAGRYKEVPLYGMLMRLVHNQEYPATSRLVDSLAEQAQLEAIIEQSKPTMPLDATELHYLISAPFRYTALPGGSRFGSPRDRGPLYGSKTVKTALAEAAYYRFVLWDSMETPPLGSSITTQHTLLGVVYNSERALKLQDPPFEEHKKGIANPGSYEDTHEIGTGLRKAGIEVIQYPSARDPDDGLNIAVLTPAALTSAAPAVQQQWMCETRADSVAFLSHEAGLYVFGREQFMRQGRLPRPAVEV